MDWDKATFDFRDIPTKCDNCGSENISFVSNSVIYGREYGNGGAYLCYDCRAYVGVHDTKHKKPLGRLSNAELRNLKRECHELFDVYWRSKEFKRSDCYGYLAVELDLWMSECHFGWFNKEYLIKALEVLRRTKKSDIQKYIDDRKIRKELEKNEKV